MLLALSFYKFDNYVNPDVVFECRFLSNFVKQVKMLHIRKILKSIVFYPLQQEKSAFLLLTSRLAIKGQHTQNCIQNVLAGCFKRFLGTCRQGTWRADNVELPDLANQGTPVPP